MDLRPVLQDIERFPAIEDLRFLKSIIEDESAPEFNFKSGDRLDHEKLKRVKEYHDEIKSVKPWFSKFKGQKGFLPPPSWFEAYINNSRKNVPGYLNLPESLDEIPTISRNDLRKAPWNYVSDTADIDNLLVYSTSGTTGPPVDVMFDAVTQACYLPKLIEVLKKFGVEIDGRPDRVSIALICFQDKTLTYASLSSYLNNSGILKINLNKNDWKSPKDRIKFLEKYNPSILTGDPFAFAGLIELNPDISPTAIISSASRLLPGLKKELEKRFSCPVIDIYSLTECRMISYAFNDGYRFIRHDLWAEIFDPVKDEPLPLGKRGELVISCCLNPYLNLIRYRTGDFGSIEWDGDEYILKDFEGRSPVIFYDEKMKIINSVDISRALSNLNIPGYQIQQNKELSIEVTIYSNVNISEKVNKILNKIFGPSIDIKIVLKAQKEMSGNKITTYLGSETLVDN